MPEADGLSWTWKARQAELAAEQGGDAAGVRGGLRVVETWRPQCDRVGAPFAVSHTPSMADHPRSAPRALGPLPSEASPKIGS